MQKKVNKQPIRSIKQQPNKAPYNITSQQHLKSVISNFIIKECYSKHSISHSKISQSHSHNNSVYIKNNKNGHNKVQYTIPLIFEQKDSPINIDLYMILNHYINICYKLVQLNRSLDEITKDAVQFIMGLENINFCGDFNNKQAIQQIIINQIIEYRQRIKKQHFDTEYAHLNRTFLQEAKKTTIFRSNKQPLMSNHHLLNDNTQRNSQVVSRNTIQSVDLQERISHDCYSQQKQSKLKTLLSNCNIFSQPHKLQALKKQILIKSYCVDGEAQYKQIKKSIDKNDIQVKNTNLSGQMVQFIKDWINDISLSQKLFQNMQKNNVKGIRSHKKVNLDSSFSSEKSILS